MNALYERAGRIAAGSTQGDGRFRIFRTKSVNQTGVFVTVRGHGFEPLARSARQYPWGAVDLRFVLKPALRFSLRVVDADTGAPIIEYCVRTASLSKPGGGNGSRLHGPHAEGKVVVDDIWRGRNAIVVIPSDHGYRIPRHVEFQSTDQAPGPSKTAIQKMYPLKVVVRDSERKPVGGCPLELILPGIHAVNAGSHVQDLRDETHGWSPTVSGFAELLYRAKTDALGQCVVYGIKGRNNLVIRLTHRTHTSVHEDVKVGESNLRLDIVLR